MTLLKFPARPLQSAPPERMSLHAMKPPAHPGAAVLAIGGMSLVLAVAVQLMGFARKLDTVIAGWMEGTGLEGQLRALPPLLKGYLRLGASFGRGAVVDRQFGTTDVLVILPVSAINPRYIDHFGPTANRHLA